VSLLASLRSAAEHAPLVAGSREVHLHLLTFASLRASADELTAALGPDERLRACGFRSAARRERFCAARGALRRLIALHVNAPAESLAFAYGPHGKPSLRGHELAFSVSHAGDHLAIALARGGSVGVDVECAERAPRGDHALRMAARFFTPVEYAKLASLPPAGRGRAFLRCWTQKEAYVKALGDGLALGLDEFEVAVLPGEPCGLLAARRPSELTRWRFFETDATGGVHAAVAGEGTDRRLRTWSWWRRVGASTRDVV
jgi:4'-phosphopantetheinyl transferase